MEGVEAAYRLFAEYLSFARLFFSQGRKQYRLFKDLHREHADRWCVSLHLECVRADCVRSAWALAASPRIFSLRGFIPAVSRYVQRECYSIVYGGRLHKQGRFNSL